MGAENSNKNYTENSNKNNNEITPRSHWVITEVRNAETNEKYDPNQVRKLTREKKN